jgi:hypothetical protein
MTTLAVMQPYFFPYIGYWQLMRAADRFVVYDDVNYIKGGWINRNRILVQGAPAFITVPLVESSPYKRIHALEMQPTAWRDKLVKTLAQTYAKAACFGEVFPVVEQLILHEENNLARYLVHQLQGLARFMGITTEFVVTSLPYDNAHLSGQERVIDICRREKIDVYINAKGGQELYTTDAFHQAGVDLRFLSMQPLPYRQKAADFVPYLSILDALMSTGVAGIQQHLDAFELTANAR